MYTGINLSFRPEVFKDRTIYEVLTAEDHYKPAYEFSMNVKMS